MTRYQHLPPPPDVATGEPRPPEAIKVQGAFTPNGDRETRERRVKIPEPPPGWGPMLEWQQHPRKSRYQAATAIAVAAALLITLKDWGFGWAVDGVYWALIAAAAAVTYLFLSDAPIGAGARWVWFNGCFVATYKLTKVEVTRSYMAHDLILEGPRHSSPMRWRNLASTVVQRIRRGTQWLLTLGGYSGADTPSGVRINIVTLQENPALWALVYNGIRHAVNDGAECDDETRKRLGLNSWPDVDVW